MGRACARRLAGVVDEVFLVDRDAAALDEAAAAFSAGGETSCRSFVFDATDPNEMSELAARVAETGRLRAGTSTRCACASLPTRSAGVTRGRHTRPETLPLGVTVSLMPYPLSNR